MKSSSRKRWSGIRIAAVAACAAFSVAAIAGSRYGQPSVSIAPDSSGGGIVMGTLGGVRNSASTVERLMCSITRNETTSSAGVVSRFTSVSCSARDVNGVLASCVSNNDAHAMALDGASNDSLIEFHYNAAGKCTSMIVYESASLERKR